MQTNSWMQTAPGGRLMQQGLADFIAGRQTVAACLVAIARTRLHRAGFLPDGAREAQPEPERELYRLLRNEGGDAYSRYNSLLRELVSFEQSLDRSSGCDANGSTRTTTSRS